VLFQSVKNINCKWVSVISDTPDIANARIEFENGCVANLTGKYFDENMRKHVFFQRCLHRLISRKKCEVVKMKDAPEVPGDFDMILQNAEGKKTNLFSNPDVETKQCYSGRIRNFCRCYKYNTTQL
jgi:hypothetical protein